MDWGTAAKVTVKVTADDLPVTGTVELREGDKVRGTGTLNAGTASFPLPVGLASGTHPLTVSYSGSDSLDAATGVATVTVNLPPAWSPAASYKAGTRVSLDGKVYLASWASQNQKPGAPYGAWEELAMTEDGTTIWTASRVFRTGDRALYEGRLYEAKWFNNNQPPSTAPSGPWKPIG
ncbi:Ig-like domain repeat protein [Kribbella sp. NPDC051620]|uniref:Ig-like domain repeat protein n=1 Tax=Kribbella sp. NPDC051620 TaxID=3364120 RepID=UPI0037938B61